MKALVIPKHGPPEVFIEAERPVPEIKPNEILIRTEAAGVNFADLMGRMGLYPEAPKPPFVPGYEVCGVVEKIGANVAGIAVGTRVMAFSKFNGYAEYVAASAAGVFPLPQNLSPTEGAAVPVNYLTAYVNLITVGNAKSGERILVYGGTGGVGNAMLQLARGLGVEIFATCGSEEKVAYLKKLGVEHAINYRTSDVLAAVRRLTAGKGVHLVLDPVGGESIRRDFHMLAPLGRIVCYGASSLAPGSRRNIFTALWQYLRFPRVNPIRLMQRNFGILGVNLNQLWNETALLRTAWQNIGEGLSSGKLRPVIAATFPFSAKGAADAHRFLHERKNIGKVVFEVTR